MNNPTLHPMARGISKIRSGLPDGFCSAFPTGFPTDFPEDIAAEKWRAKGISTDELNRPLNPHLFATLRNEDLKTGRGIFYNFGPNFTADPVVIAGDGARKVLLIKRKDSGIWALPGGFREEISAPNFADPETALDAHLETSLSAAARELTEETGLTLREKDALFLGHLVCQDPRETAHAWAETDGFLWHIPRTRQVRAGDDAADANWFNLANLPDEMTKTHIDLIETAQKSIEQRKILGKDFIITPENVAEIAEKMAGWIREKSGDGGVILGLSGGIDSAVVARLAQKAGVNLKVLLLPDGEKARESEDFLDAQKLAQIYGMNYEIRDIAKPCAAIKSLADFLAQTANSHLAEINVAPRVRAGILYEIGQIEGRRVVGTDNLAEQITGYFTKFGDGAYDFNPLKSCTKSEVYLLAKHLGVISEILDRPPSAGLFENQTDEDEMGISYKDLDNWAIFGTSGNAETDEKIRARFSGSTHKREMPAAFSLNSEKKL